MRVPLRFLLPLALFPAAVPPAAQESRVPFDAAQIVIEDDLAPLRALFDFDGDGDLDALAFQRKSDATEFRSRVWANDGTGTLSSVFDELLPALPGTGTDDALLGAAGDHDGDGRDDFALGMGLSLRLYTALEAGDPLFAIVGETLPAAVRDLAFADLDGDPALELLVLTATAVEIRWGAGGATAMPHGGGADRLIVAETDGDALDDFALVNTAGDFLTPAVVEAGAVGPGAIVGYDAIEGEMVDAGDVDGDGDEDFAVFGSSTYQILRRTGDTSWVAELPAAGGPAEFLFDVDGDGDLDGLCCGSSGGGGPPPPGFPGLGTLTPFEVALGDGTGAFDASFSIPGQGSPQLAGAGDMDGDGDPDLVAGRCIYWNRGTLTADHHQRQGKKAYSSPAILFDFDGDGDADHAPDPGQALGWSSDGTGVLTQAPLVVPPPPAGLATVPPYWYGDFDGDGDVDVVAREQHAGTFGAFTRHVLLLNAGGGGLVPGGDAAAPGTVIEAGSGGQRAVPGDPDLDGDLDLFLTTDDEDDEESVLWLNDGGGFFTAGETFPDQRVERCGDLDADGIPDLVVWQHVESPIFSPVRRIFLRRGLGGGLFGPLEDVFLDVNHQIDVPDRPLDFADYNGDGFIDVGAVSHAGQELLLLNPLGLGGGPLWANVTPLPDSPFLYSNSGQLDLRGVDFDVDGLTDLVVGHYQSNPATVGCFRRLPGSGGLLDAASYDEGVFVVTPARLPVDADGDGDFDLAGDWILEGARFTPPADGRRRQFGQGTPGSGGMTPVLGATGPFRLGEEVEVRLRGTLGGALSILAFGPTAAELPGFPTPSTTTYVEPLGPGFVVLSLPTGGAPGAPGEGGWTIEFPVPPSLATAGPFYHQAFALDPGAAFGFSATAGLELDYGL